MRPDRRAVGGRIATQARSHRSSRACPSGDATRHDTSGDWGISSLPQRRSRAQRPPSRVPRASPHRVGTDPAAERGGSPRDPLLPHEHPHSPFASQTRAMRGPGKDAFSPASRRARRVQWASRRFSALDKAVALPCVALRAGDELPDLGDSEQAFQGDRRASISSLTSACL